MVKIDERTAEDPCYAGTCAHKQCACEDGRCGHLECEAHRVYPVRSNSGPRDPVSVALHVFDLEHPSGRRWVNSNEHTWYRTAAKHLAVCAGGPCLVPEPGSEVAADEDCCQWAKEAVASEGSYWLLPLASRARALAVPLPRRPLINRSDPPRE